MKENMDTIMVELVRVKFRGHIFKSDSHFLQNINIFLVKGSLARDFSTGSAKKN
jgi:hypothetical protein